ncbi:hypothetical protein GCM10017667_77930 [Streptomyces filamentosus]|uniref:Uncharacterized protein n=1 Tax=Streptomyces filamentosus TaxID=67294 RepID=A0A919BY77_STRFL|nr:hypothetical protein GCM10017667_77930 [Streptomyces filamentosus]
MISCICGADLVVEARFRAASVLRDCCGAAAWASGLVSTVIGPALLRRVVTGHGGMPDRSMRRVGRRNGRW